MTYDVVVLGSGAAGLTAALAAAVAGARVGLFEKAGLIGGTTALSGGTFWVPGNQLARRAAVEDSRERGLRYLVSLSNGMILPGTRRGARRRRSRARRLHRAEHSAALPAR